MGSQVVLSDADIVERKKFDMTAVNRSVAMNEDAAALFNSEIGNIV